MQTTNLSGPVPELGLPATGRPDPVAQFAANMGISTDFNELLSATRRIFPGPVWVEVDEDPEIADCRYFVFHVETAGDAPEDSRRRREWYRVSRDMLREHEDKLRLTIDS